MSAFGGTTRFRVIRSLGVGGMGAVYEAFDREQRVRVALKTLLAFTPQSIERFKREFRALQGLRHANLVSLGELFEDAGQWFFTMELVEGSDVLGWVRPGGVLELDRLRRGLAQLADVLEAIHAAGKIHRDIKPSNVRVSPDGRLTLLDFGLVRDAAADGVSGDNIVGTAAYMAPEQALSGEVGPAADWYAFGVLAYEALTGQLPFDGGPLQILLDKQRREPPPPATLAAVPADLDALVVALLRFDPTLRPDAAGVRAALGAPPAPPTTALLPTVVPFVGRAVELAQLGAAFAETQAGAPVALVLQGESGVGKSALVRAFVERVSATTPDVIVLAGHCYESESVPFKALDGAMEDLARHLKRLEPAAAAQLIGDDAALVLRLFPVFANVPAVRRAAEAPRWALAAAAHRDQRAQAFAAVRGLLVRLGERAPVIVAIDDLQWADGDSLALLGALLEPPQAPRLLLVATARRGAPPVAELGRLVEDVRTLELTGLPAADARALAELLSEHLATDVDPEHLARETAGHPLYLHELVRHAAEVGHAESVRLDEALTRRIDALEGPAQRLLEVLAVAGTPVPLRVATHAAALDVALGMRMAALLRVAMLARSVGQRADDLIEPYHDRVRAAVAARVGDAAAIHARLADALDEAGAADPRLLVRHLEGAGDAGRAAEVAARAATRARDALAFDRAAELYGIALRLGRPPPAERRRLHVALGDAHAGVGRCLDAADAYLAAIDPDDPGGGLELRRRAAEQLLIGGYVDRGLAVVGALFAELGVAVPASPRAAVASLLWRRLQLRLRGGGWRVRDPSRIPPRDLQVLELHRTVGMGLSHIDFVRGADFNLRALRLARRAGQPAHVANSLLLHVTLRAAEGVGREAVVADLLRQAEAVVAATDDPALRARLHGSRGMCSYFMGRFAEALPELDRAEAELRGQPGANLWYLNNYRLFGLFALHYLGRYAELGKRVDRHFREARKGDRWMQVALVRGMNAVWVVRGELDRARELLDTVWSPPPGDFYHVVRWYGLLARGTLCLYTRDRRALPALVAEVAACERSLLTRVQLLRVETNRLGAQLAAFAGDGREVRRRLARLRREGVGYADRSAAMIEAGFAPGPATYAAALAANARAGNALDTAAIAVRRDGDAAAAARMRAQGLVDPERVARLVLVGPDDGR